MSCGDHPDNAVAMLEEAVRIVVEHAVSDHESSDEWDRKRITHPLRLGARASEDENWEAFQDLNKINFTEFVDWFSLKELADGLDERILVEGNLEIETRSGVVKVNVWFHDHGFVPAERFRVEYEERFPRSKGFSVRSSVLKRAGDDGQNVVTAHAISVLGERLVTSAQVKRVEE